MKINVIGSGSMGKQIVSLFILMGFDVFLWQNSKNKYLEEQIKKEIEKLKHNFSNYEDGNLTIVNDLSSLDENFTIETIKEDIKIKIQIIESTLMDNLF